MVTFEYTPINLEGLDFRLVRLEAGTGPNIKCELIHASLDRDVIIPYEAVSYTWGSPLKADVIDIQGSQLHITLNLSLILHDLRSSDEDRILWIDAICIDQENLEERGHQVRQMGGIYNRAERVLFCLGRPTEMTHIVMTSLAELQTKCGGARWALEDRRWKETWNEAEANLQKTYSHLQDRLRQGLVHLLAQPWFRRVWILQEVANSKAAFIYCGTEWISARFFALCPRLIGVEPDPHCQAVLDMMPTKPRSESEWSQGQDLYCLLRNFAAAEAQDDRDKIFALLGMCTGGNGRGTLIADYKKDVKDIIRETISYLCFFDADFLPQLPYETMEDFISSVEHLHSTMLRYLVQSRRTSSVESLLQERGQYITITSETVEAATCDEEKGKYLIDILLKQRGAKVKNIEKVLEAVVANTKQGKDLLETLLKQRGDEFKITERVLQAAVANSTQGKDLLETLLKQRGDEFKITERVLQAAVANSTQGKDLLEILLKQRRVEVKITESVLEAAYHHGVQGGDNWVKREYVIELLLSRLEEEIVDTAAAADTVLGNGLIGILLMYQEKGSKIKDEVLKAATTNGAGPKLLKWAAEMGDNAFIQRLLQNGLDIKVVENNEGKEALWQAIKNGHESTVRLLLEKGASIETQNASGQTPLSLAIENRREDIVRLLLEKGANIEAQNASGQTPLGLAIENRREDIVQLLLGKGANIEAQNAFGQTPLGLAVAYRCGAIIRLLLENGANIEAQNTSGQTPLSLAKAKGYSPIIELLRKNGAYSPTLLQRVYNWWTGL